MNNARRKNLTNIRARIEELKSDLELLLEEEQEAFDNMPESIQYSDRGETMEEGISALEDAVSSLEESMEYIDTAIE